MSTSLYRHFAADGVLLYVGISLSWPARTKAHAHGSRWFDQVARVEIEQFPTREAALEAERDAIKGERPKHNVIHNRQPDAAPKAARGEHRNLRRVTGDPVLDLVTGPDAIVGPVLNYREDLLSVFIAQGVSGEPGYLVEIVLGRWAGEVPDFWNDACDGIFTLRMADEITLAEARETRSEIVRKLRQHLRTVEVFDSDIALAVANASRFPSEKARQILDDVAVERGVT